ncbi:MAG: hypothetical protein KatS3mg009_1664 [Acidimicrobiia bacterium]|nr:MAG: hypothetical protein KatS3mg009_1664 [Acidimicrobiia bacterium]
MSGRPCSPPFAPTSPHRGHATGEIAWVSNLRFYGKCGATVSRVFRGAHLTLRAR